MPDIDTLATLAELLSGAAVIGGAAFAVIQLREFRRQRQANAAVELVRSFYNPDLAQSVRLIRLLPDRCSAAELRAKGPEYEEAAILVSFAFETIGLLVFRRVTPFSIVEDLTGGLAILMWGKLEQWQRDVRAENGDESWAEWFQWLAERLLASDAPPRPAYEAFSDWRASS